MSPASPHLIARQNAYSDPWDSWARWTLLGVFVFFLVFVYFLFSCISARRRRRLGHAPFRGTGWAVYPTPPAQGHQQYNSAAPYHANNQAQGWSAPPPPYGGAPLNQQGNAGAGNYGNQQGGIELQQPQQAHSGWGGPSSYPQGGNNVYQPPPGPPPQK